VSDQQQKTSAEMVTARKAASILGFSQPQVYKMIRRGELPPSCFVHYESGIFRFDPTELRKWRDSQRGYRGPSAYKRRRD
jgi:predicted DNA-binding transcriptional regulator AlpA